MKKILLIICAALFTAAALLLIGSRLSTHGTVQFYSVLSDSMQPTIPSGALAIIKRNPGIPQTGQIIAFHNPENTSQIITHRISKTVIDNGQRRYVTKGDAAALEDPWTLPDSAVIGIYKRHLLYIGGWLTFLRSGQGMVLFLIIPTLLLAGYEIIAVLNEIRGQLPLSLIEYEGEQ